MQFYQDLLSNMKNFGLEPKNDINLDGTIKRYSRDSDNKNEKDEWYIGYELDSGHIYCTFGSWSTSYIDKQTYTSYGKGHQLSESERKKIEEIRKKSQEEIEKIRIQAQELAKKKWNEAKMATKSHPYIQKKGIVPYGARVIKGINKFNQNIDYVILPMYDQMGEFAGLEYIHPDGTKRSIKGSKKTYSSLPLSNPDESNRLFVAEGWATACSLQQAHPNDSVIVCFGLGNMKNILELLAIKYPKKPLFSCIDLEKVDAPEIDVEPYKKLSTVYRPFIQKKHREEGFNDFNDVHQLYGLNEVKKQTAPRQYFPVSFHDFMARNYPPLEWLCKPLIHKGCMSVLYAREGVGKSYLMYELGFCLAAGIKFLGNKCEKSSVLYIDGELNGREIQQRIDGSLYRLGLTDEQKQNMNLLSILCRDDLIDMGMETINIFNRECQQMLEVPFKDHDVIILDNLLNLGTMESEGNWLSTEVSQKSMLNWIRFWKAQDKAIILINHANKTNDMYGSNLIRTDATTCVKLERLVENDDLLFRVEKCRNLPRSEAPSLRLRDNFPEDRENIYKRKNGCRTLEII